MLLLLPYFVQVTKEIDFLQLQWNRSHDNSTSEKLNNTETQKMNWPKSGNNNSSQLPHLQPHSVLRQSTPDTRGTFQGHNWRLIVHLDWLTTTLTVCWWLWWVLRFHLLIADCRLLIRFSLHRNSAIRSDRKTNERLKLAKMLYIKSHKDWATNNSNLYSNLF